VATDTRASLLSRIARASPAFARVNLEAPR
jgi:hypothetical protein